MYESTSLLLLILVASQSVNAGFWRRSFEENPEATLDLAVREINAGMDIGKQAAIDKREAEERSLTLCDHSKCTKDFEVPNTCNVGFQPLFAKAEGEECSCITGYSCCPEECPAPADKWSQCKKNSEIPVLRHDCCGCPEYSCLPCPAINETCANKCDQAVKYYDEDNQCPFVRCERKQVAEPTKPTCSACKRLRTNTDECGHHSYECECAMTPAMVKSQCTPEKLPEKDCNNVVKKNHAGIFGCDEAQKSCLQCFHWAYEPEERSFAETKCKPCEIAKVVKTTCGFKTVCECRKFDNCHPEKPESLPCHTIQKVLSADTSLCDDDDESGCKACYTWKYVADELSHKDVTCDTRCTYKKPLSKECGSGAECECIGKDPKFCQPPKPASNNDDCYEPVKLLTPGSFMCEKTVTPLTRVFNVDKRSAQTCVQCWSWIYAKKLCPAQAAVACSDGCENKLMQHDACGCKSEKCTPQILDKCEPAKLEEDECYTAPNKVYTSEKSFKGDGCVDCYYWNRTIINFPTVDECKHRELPKECYASYSVTGKCNKKVKKCEKSTLGCQETYGEGERSCPTGQDMIRLNNKCGSDRDACVKCSKIVREQQLSYAKKCYKTERLILHDVCKQDINVKKECDFKENLVVTECIAGQKMKIFIDECNCPTLKCFGCPNNKKVDVQLLLDSSGSMENFWKEFINEIKSEFIGSIMTNPESRMAIAKFGTKLKSIVSLSTTTDGSSLDGETNFAPDDVGPYTYTAGALENLLPSFQENLGDSTATKILIVATDGDATDKNFVREKADQWKKVVDKIYVIGFGALDKQGLIDTAAGSEKDVVLMPDFASFKKSLLQTIVPNVCGTAPIPL